MLPSRRTRFALAPALVLALALALSGCLGQTSPSPTPPASATAPAPATATPTPTPSPTPSPTPTPTPTPSPSPTPSSGFTIDPNAGAEALFGIRDECTNPDDGYVLEYPEVWWTNTEIGSFPACVWFSPTFYEVPDPSQRPPEIAIEIFLIPGAREEFLDPVASETGMVGGQPATRAEYRSPDGAAYEYVIQLGPSPESGPNLVARTGTEMGGDYELNKAILDRIMGSLQFTGTVQ
jgi:hypothetical protein